MTYSPELFKTTVTFEQILSGTSSRDDYITELTNGNDVIVNLTSTGTGKNLRNRLNPTNYPNGLTSEHLSRLVYNKITFINRNTTYSINVNFELTDVALPAAGFSYPTNAGYISIGAQESASFLFLIDSNGDVGAILLGKESLT